MLRSVGLPSADKTYRIHAIFNNQNLQVKSISNLELIPRLLALLLCEAIVQILWNVLDRPVPTLEVDSLHTNVRFFP